MRKNLGDHVPGDEGGKRGSEAKFQENVFDHTLLP